MRKSALGLALLAAAQLTVFSSPAFADGPAPPTEETNNKVKHGWIVLGIGGGVTVGGIVVTILGATHSTYIPGETGTTTTNARTNLFWGGTALIITGVVTGVVGGSMILNPNDDANKKPADRPQDDASSDVFGKSVTAALQSAPTVTVPILGTTF